MIIIGYNFSSRAGTSWLSSLRWIHQYQPTTKEIRLHSIDNVTLKINESLCLHTPHRPSPAIQAVAGRSANTFQAITTLQLSDLPYQAVALPISLQRRTHNASVVSFPRDSEPLRRHLWPTWSHSVTRWWVPHAANHGPRPWLAYL